MRLQQLTATYRAKKATSLNLFEVERLSAEWSPLLYLQSTTYEKAMLYTVVAFPADVNAAKPPYLAGSLAVTGFNFWQTTSTKRASGQQSNTAIAYSYPEAASLGKTTKRAAAIELSQGLAKNAFAADAVKMTEFVEHQATKEEVSRSNTPQGNEKEKRGFGQPTAAEQNRKVMSILVAALSLLYLVVYLANGVNR